MKKEVIVYQTKNGALELKGDLDRETIWARQEQIVSLFGVDQSVVSRHIKNIFEDREVDPKSNMQKMHIPNSDKPVVFYSLDVILAVGYRTNSRVAIDFRKWATKTLRDHIVNGYTINKKRVTKNYDNFLEAVDSVKKLLPSGGRVEAKDALELVKMFARTWLSLDAYDKSTLPKSGTAKKRVKIIAGEIKEALAKLKQDLSEKREAAEIFGIERDPGAFPGIIGNIFQSFGKKELYPTVEEKAAHLLYFTVKNHPFIDGNKRSGAFAFVWFLNKAGILQKDKMSPEALAALTLLVAESDSKNKDRMIGLILQLLRK